MKEILIIHPDLCGGGAEKVLVNMLNNIDYNKYNVTLLLIYKRGIYLNDINSNVKIKYIYDSNKFKSRIIQSIYCRSIMFLYEKKTKLLYSLINRKKYDVEISFLEGEATKFLNNSTNINSKKLAWVHIDMHAHTYESIAREKFYYTNIDEIICVSKDCKNSFDKIFSEYKEKTKVIYNLIDRDNILNQSNEIINYEFNKNTIVAVGRLVEQKRFDVLIKAHKLLIEEGIDSELLILGIGECKKNLEDLIKKYKLERYVKLLGFSKNPYPYIKNADIFVSSSDFEGFSLVIAEAMILNKAIVSTKTNGPIELLDDGKYGILVDCNNPEQLKDSMKLILQNKDKKKYYEQKSNERNKIFEKETIIKQIHSCFE